MKNASEIFKDMILYYNGDVKRINHALKVYGFAKCIGESEEIPEEKQLILEIAAILHDIGIPESERKYNSSAGKYQEIEGPIIATEILNKYNLPDKFTERIYFLIGNHHTYNKIDEIDFQILVESDFLVNIYEGNLDNEPIVNVRRNYFKTKTGKEIIDSMFMLE